MIDIPGIYVGRFKDDPNQSTMLMRIGDTPAYTDDNWANVESTGTIWRYSSEAGEWVDTGLEEILVEKVSGTKQIVAEGTVPWKLQGLNVYGKSVQNSLTGAQKFSVLGEAVSQQFSETDSVTVTPVQNGEFSVAATVSERREIFFITEDDNFTLAAGDYMFSVETEEYGFDIQLYKNGENYGSINHDDSSQGMHLEEGDVITLQFGVVTNFSENIKIMVNSGRTALPWEPYTGGKPSPSPDYPQEIVTAGSDGSIDISVSDGADQSQQLSIQTPNGLPGIPVDSGGNFTDADGQQWICDEIDFKSGKYVKRVEKIVIDGEEMKFTQEGSGKYWNLPLRSAEGIIPQSPIMSMYFPRGIFSVNDSYDFIFTMSTAIGSYFSSANDLNEFCTEKSAEGKPPELYYVIDSIETPLSAEELVAYAALMSYDGTTVISTDEDVSGISAKVVTDVISKNAWFDPYAELALYYKALAGFESLDNLPMPHSRESSLVRKLLDSSYELGFSVNENSSRNERYLWDLINGTTLMLTNVPKSDTEKFLHVMIGGRVEEYPVIDTELDYWMDKCVHYMNSNGNIGG